MQRNFIRKFLVMTLLLLMMGTSFIASHNSAYASDGPLVTIDDQTVPLVHQAQYLQPTNPDQPLTITLGLQTRNQQELTSLVEAVNNPKSSLYHQFLTPAQFNTRFAPTDDQVQQVVSFLQSQGLTVTNVSSNNLLITASTTVSQAQQAFNIQINDYKLGTQTFYANASSPAVPSTIRSLITSVGGLENSTRFHSYHHLHPHRNATLPTGFTPSGLATAYDYTALQSSGIMGDNRNIALLELDGYQASDIAQYASYFNLGTITASNTLVDGFNGTAGQNAIEVELDMEVIAAVAPHASQLIYEGPNTAQGFNDTVNRIVTDNRTTTVSISWGECESVTGSANLQTLDTIFQQGAVQGMSFFAASGDAGAYDCQDTNLAVDYPASDPNVTAVGGTNLQVNTLNGSYVSESVWSNPHDILYGPMGSGSGGGLSSTWTQPSWQSGPGVLNSYSNGKREIPDVSANADPTTGYAIYCTVTSASCPATGWVSVGGTSAAAPLWAASSLLVSQYLISQGKSPLGLVNPLLYGLYNAQQAYPAYHSVTTGNNLYYPATSNYSLATGIGTPDVYNIARDLNMGGLLAQDTFHRANQTYWGTASDGHAWTMDASNNPAFSIVNNTGQISGGYITNALIGPVVQNAEVLFTGSISTFSSSNFGTVLHWVDNNNWYKASLDGNLLLVQKKLNGNVTAIGTATFPATPNTLYTIRFRMVNSTLSAKVWVAGQTEPTNWMITVSDSSFQTGYCGLRMSVTSGAAETVTSFQVSTAQ